MVRTMIWAGGTRRFQATRSAWGISEFIPKKVMMDPSNGFLINNNCVFGAEVFIIKKFAMSECLSIKSATIPYMCNWRISNLSKLGHCWTSEEFVGEGLKWFASLNLTSVLIFSINFTSTTDLN